MLHYNSLRKYTMGLLSTFNDIEIQYLAKDKVTILNQKIPIRFSNREKSTLLSEHETSQILSGNTNVLPRMSLLLTSVIKSDVRTTNKFTKHNIQSTGDETASFNYNPVAYEFLYELVIQCRGMNEASMIIEQISPYFNPNYTMRINELPGVYEASSVPVSLLDIGIESEEYEEISTNLVNVSMGLSLKGSFYPQPHEASKINEYKIYTSTYQEDEFVRKSLQEWDVQETIVEPSTQECSNFVDTIIPTISDIEGTFTLGTSQVEVIYEDKYNKPEELIYVWNVVSGDATIQTGSNVVELTINSGTTVEISSQIIDIHGNTSSIFNKIL